MGVMDLSTCAAAVARVPAVYRRRGICAARRAGGTWRGARRRDGAHKRLQWGGPAELARLRGVDAACARRGVPTEVAVRRAAVPAARIAAQEGAAMATLPACRSAATVRSTAPPAQRAPVVRAAAQGAWRTARRHCTVYATPAGSRSRRAARRGLQVRASMEDLPDSVKLAMEQNPQVRHRASRWALMTGSRGRSPVGPTMASSLPPAFAACGGAVGTETWPDTCNCATDGGRAAQAAGGAGQGQPGGDGSAAGGGRGALEADAGVDGHLEPAGGAPAHGGTQARPRAQGCVRRDRRWRAGALAPLRRCRHSLSRRSRAR
eukprot:scaffold3431_cov307-Prasinococcus_capsulatus_cf.AAC.3